MIRVRHGLSLVPLLIWLTACGGGAATAATTTPGPDTAVEPSYLRVEGERAHPTPVTALSTETRGLYQEFETAVAAELAPPDAQSMADMARWAREELAPFTSAHVRRLAALEEHATRLAHAGTVPDRVFAALLVGRAWERFYDLLAELPAPPAVADDDELARVYRAELLRTALPIARRAAVAYRACAQQPEVQGIEAWRARCTERAQRLEGVEPPARPAAASRPPPNDPSTPPVGMIGVLRPDSDSGPSEDGAGTTSALGALDPDANAAILVESCETDADCDEGMVCAPLGTLTTRDGAPVRACHTRAP